MCLNYSKQSGKNHILKKNTDTQIFCDNIDLKILAVCN